MRKTPAVLLLSVAVPAFSALPVMSPPGARPAPVAPKVHELRLTGVDAAALRSAGTASLRASAAARAEVTDPAARGAGPAQRPLVLTAARSTEPFELVGVTWRNGSAGDVTVLVRTHTGGRWTGWSSLAEANVDTSGKTEQARAPRTGTEPYYAGPSDGVQVRVDVRAGRAPADLRVELIDPGESKADDAVGQAPLAAASAAIGKPTIYTRAQWGADERLRSSPPAYSSTIKGGFVHHTDGANGYASADVPKIIRGIYAYHTKSNGWSDIGYNFLVDRFGRLWEGRYGGMDRPVIGAHTGGFNDDTFGISAIGNYDTAAAPSAMVTSIARLMAWKLSLHYRNPNGTMTLTSTGGGTSRYSAGTVVTKPAISGHRDMGYTACPGRYLYSYMSTIRSKAVAYLAVGLVNPSVSVTTTSARVRSGVLKSGQSWAVTLKNAATGVQISRVTGTGSVDATRPLTDAKGQPLPDGRYTLTVDSWYGTTTARPYVSTIILGTPGAVKHDMNGDKKGDVVARVASTGDLRLYFGSGAGGFNGATTVAPAWNGMSVIEGVGDFDGDQLADVVAVENETGSLFLYPGNGAGGFGERRQIGHNWGGLRLITGIGDFNSDDTMDLVGVTADGSLLLYQGDGKGGFKGSSVAGRGWSGFDKLVGMGDVDGDGHPDLLGRVSAQARLAFYRGDGTGRFFSGNTLTGTGWNAMSELMSPGDFDGDRHPDLLAIERATGTLWLYHGSGTTLPSRRAAGSGWSGIDILG